MGVILECTYIIRSNVIIVEIIVLFADVFAACIGEADIAARIIRNLDSFRDFACGKRFDGLRIAECHIFIIVERYCDIGESALRFVLKRDFLVGVGNLLGDIGVGFQAIGVPGVVCAILQAVRVKDMVPHGINIQPCVRPIHLNGMLT